jgi:hypothetical protein
MSDPLHDVRRKLVRETLRRRVTTYLNAVARKWQCWDACDFHGVDEGFSIDWAAYDC